MKNIGAKEVHQLRKMSGAGMMECKSALLESNGDTEKAFKLLRAKGIAKAEKKSTRNTNEGLIGVRIFENEAVIIEVNSETDFVSRNKEFQNLVKNILDIAIKQKGDSAKIVKNSLNNINDAIRKVGENIKFKRSNYIQGNVHSYVHNSLEKGLGKIGVILQLNSDQDTDLTDVGKNLCMHIAACSPKSISEHDLDSSIVDSEKEIIIQQLKNSNKPENILSKIIDGKLNTFLEEIILLKQRYVIDPNMTIENYINEMSKNKTNKIKIEKFIRFELGE